MRTLALGFPWFGCVSLRAQRTNRRHWAVALVGTAPVTLAALVGLILAVPHRGDAAGCSAPSFGVATTFGVGNGPDSVAVGDFSGDGHLDLAVVNGFDNPVPGTVSVLLGTGTGSFGAATNFAVGAFPGSVAVGDFNGDGHLDLAVANGFPSTVSILLGTGTGSFGAATNFTVGFGADSVAIGDFNGDGHLDLATANAGDNTVSILLGTGTGSFGAATNFGVGTYPTSVAVGDFNGDGHLDLAVANGNDSTVSILLGTGTGSFGAATNFGVGTYTYYPSSVAVGDFNGDGHLDLATANEGTVSVLLGTGTGSFGAATSFGVGCGSPDTPDSVAVGDFNGDGHLDLAVAIHNDNEGACNTVSVFLGTGTGNFGAETPFGVGDGPWSVAIGDFNGDGHLDLAVVNGGDNTVSVLLNGCGAASMATPTPTSPASTTVTPTAACVGDCNHNGRVTVDDILTMANIALGNTPVTTCEAGDANHDGEITVDEILTAVNHALSGCAVA
ncbi:MAG: FG-GAP-like repeat-containing protein [Candidatus Binatia bacterium]